MHREVATIYFDTRDPANSDVILRAAIKRAQELDIMHLVVASTTGRTALRASQLADEARFTGKIVAVGEHAGFKEPGVQLMPDETRAELEKRGVRVVIGTHALSSVSRSFRLKYGGIGMLETISETLRLFSEGIKVAVECSIMAADAGAIPVDRDIVAVAGNVGGADSALVLRAANMNRFFDLRVREVIGKPV